MHYFKWYNGVSSAAFCFGDAGGGSASPPAGAPSGGDGGGSVASPAPAGGDGGSPTTPSPAPDGGGTPPATPAPATPPEDPWAALGSFDDLDQQQPAVVPPSPAPVVPPVVPPAPPVSPPAEVPQAVPPVVPPAQVPPPTQPAPTAQPVAAPLSPSDPVGIANAMEANRNDVIAHLAQSKFALSPEDITELETDVVAAVPKIMSRVFFETQVAMQRFLAQSVPGMMKQFNTVTSANNDAEKQFFETHKELDIKNAQHRQTAIRIATVYRQSNPNIPLAQLISEVGPMVKAALQINGTLAPAPAAPPTPQGQPRGGTPFRPAVNGGGGQSPAPAAENPWSGMGQTYDE